MAGCFVLSDLGTRGQAFFPVTDRERVEGRPSNKHLHDYASTEAGGGGRGQRDRRPGSSWNQAKKSNWPEADFCLVTSYGIAESWGLL